MNMQRPPFHHYPLSVQQISDLRQEKQVLEKDIRDNLGQIRMLNNKMAKNDYEMTYLHRLQQRELILNNKRQQLDDILRTHSYLQEQVNMNKAAEQNIKHDLANQYKQVMEEKKNRKISERKNQLERQREMIRYNEKLFAVEAEKRKREQYETKKAVLEQLAMKQSQKQREKQEREKQKQLFNQKVRYRNSMETQKQATYKQYYDQFRNGQQTLHGVYQNKTAPQNQQKERMMQQFLKKEQEQFAMEQTQMHLERVQKANQDKQILKSYLQNQIKEKQMRKSLEGEMRRSYHKQSADYEQMKRDQDYIEKQRKKLEQRQYDEDLAAQIKTRRQVHGQNSSPSHRHHNPITNPIDFKMGITNPYVIKEYEHTKERFVGDKDLKLKHLAMVGNNSLQQ